MKRLVGELLSYVLLVATVFLMGAVWGQAKYASERNEWVEMVGTSQARAKHSDMMLDACINTYRRKP